MDDDTLFALVRDALGQTWPARLGVAVSGGGDSIALLHVLAALAQEERIALSVISIDHGLRPAAKEEIRTVRELCAQLGIEQHTEFWSGWAGAGNLQAAAREARFELIADWAVGNDIDVVALGHTADDQAETVLMRLARGSGVDGLSGMTVRSRRNGIDWLRPLLGVRRRDLRAYLGQRGISWIDDPSNTNPEFERVRMRNALTLLEPLGLGPEALGLVAQNMAQARTALNEATWAAAREVAVVDLGAVRLNLRDWAALPDEIARRLLVHTLKWINSDIYPPRRASVEAAMGMMRAGRTTTLAGVQIERVGYEVWLFREYATVEGLTSEVEDTWDERWSIEGPEDDPTLKVRALGPEGLAQIEGWRDIGLPRAALLSLPGIWMERELVASPVQSSLQDWQITLEDGADRFYTALLSH